MIKNDSMDFLQKYRGYFFLIGAVLAYSSMPVLVRFLDDGDMPPAAQVFLRYIVSFSFAAGYFTLTRAKFNLKMQKLWLLVLMGVVGYGLTNLFFTYAMLKTEIGSGLFIYYSFGVIAPILAYFFLGERFNKFNWIGIVLTVMGLFLLFRPNSFDTWRVGALFALLTAVSQSVYIIGRKKLPNYSSSLLMVCSTFLGILSVGLISLIMENDFYFGREGIVNITAETWLLTILFGFLNFTAWFLTNKGFEYAKVTTGSLVLLSENAFALMWGAVFFSELPTIYAIVGGICIIAASVLVIVKGKK